MLRPAAVRRGSPPDDRTVRARLMNRAAAGLLLDLIGFARGDGHVLDALITGAIIQANVQEIIRRADLQLAYANQDGLPPNELRRAVSMNALASSLKLPFETVRRRVKALVRDGYCRFVEGGVIVPTEALSAPQYYLEAFKAYERMRRFYYEAGDLGLMGPLPPATVELAADNFPVRAVGRLLGAYVLRVAETLDAVGDVLDGFAWLEIYRSNVADLPLEPGCGQGADDLRSDAERRPIAVTALAGKLGVPQETVRCRVAAMIDQGVVARVRGGLIIPSAALARPAVGAILSDNAANVQRMFGRLSQLGVLKVWDSLRPQVLAAIPQNG